MTPEQLEKGNDLSRKISNKISPIKEFKKSTATYEAVSLIHKRDSRYNILFTLKPEQMKTIKVLVLSMAEENLSELKQKFDDI